MSPHPDDELHGNQVVRHYAADGTFTDLSVDQTIASRRNMWKDWLCSAGLEHIYIDYDGDVWVGNCRVGSKLGSVFTDFRLPGDWIRCPRDYCGCGADVMIPKARDADGRALLANLNRTTRGPAIMRRESVGAAVAVEQAFRAPRQVFWDLTRRCNYSCSYCWPEVHSRTEPHKPYELLLRATDKLITEFGKGERIHFLFGGGEPTLHPNFLEWCRHIAARGCWSFVTSNGSRKADYLVELNRYAGLNLSVHFESVKEERFLENVAAIVAEKERNPATGGLEIKIMTPPGTTARAAAFRDRLLGIANFTRHASWSMVPIRSIAKFDELVDYSAEETLIFQRQPGSREGG